MPVLAGASLNSHDNVVTGSEVAWWHLMPITIFAEDE
jgi:hypothetical protein